jgi:hypothetical protein
MTLNIKLIKKILKLDQTVRGMEKKTRSTKQKLNYAKKQFAYEVGRDYGIGKVSAARNEKSCNKAPGPTANAPIKINSTANRRGRLSILEGLSIGETRKLSGCSRFTVYNAMARKNRKDGQTFACGQTDGVFFVTRTE